MAADAAVMHFPSFRRVLAVSPKESNTMAPDGLTSPHLHKKGPLAANVEVLVKYVLWHRGSTPCKSKLKSSVF